MTVAISYLKRIRRRDRVRRRVRGTDTRPRLSVFRSSKHIYAQVISDESGRTLAAASTLTVDVRDGLKSTGNKEAAKKVGEAIARLCQQNGIQSVVFDRNGFLYHGRIAALADAARGAGLQF